MQALFDVQENAVASPIVMFHKCLILNTNSLKHFFVLILLFYILMNI